MSHGSIIATVFEAGYEKTVTRLLRDWHAGSGGRMETTHALAQEPLLANRDRVRAVPRGNAGRAGDVVRVGRGAIRAHGAGSVAGAVLRDRRARSGERGGTRTRSRCRTIRSRAVRTEHASLFRHARRRRAHHQRKQLVPGRTTANGTRAP